MQTTTIDLTATKTKLADLAAHMPDIEETTCEFAAGLAPRLNDHMRAEGIALAVSLYLYDLGRGKSGFPSLPLPAKLIGYPPMIYVMMKMSVPRILRATLPPDAIEPALACLERAG